MRFDSAYTTIARRLGVKLAPRDDPEKAFGPSKIGIVFGVKYDTDSWTWGIPDEKLIRLALQIRGILQEDRVTLTEVQSVVGRIVHVKPLITDGRFHIDHLIELTTAASQPLDLVDLNAAFKKQLYFWYLILSTCNGRASIPEPLSVPNWALSCYTDAAGGTLESPGHGSGAVIPAIGWWTYMPWSRMINSGGMEGTEQKG